MKKENALLEELLIYETAKKRLLCLKTYYNPSYSLCWAFGKPLQNYPRLLKYKPSYVILTANGEWYNTLYEDYREYWFFPGDFNSRDNILSFCIQEIKEDLKRSWRGRFLLLKEKFFKIN